MTDTSAAIVVFVKTPGLSPVKTRLAAGIGDALAEEFYRLSVAAVAATVTKTANSTGATPYWAIAEEAGLDHPQWQLFARVSQGNGGLGERLHHVFQALFAHHSAVIAIGADSPQLQQVQLEFAIESLFEEESNTKYVLGRSHDGGFYLIGSRVAIPRQIWCSVTYSTADTAEVLGNQLTQTGKIEELPTLTDVDELQDLIDVGKQLRNLCLPTPEQISLLHWLEWTKFGSESGARS